MLQVAVRCGLAAGKAGAWTSAATTSSDSLGGFAVFVQVAEARSFVVAGRQLGVSASAVGKSVARPEEKLGCGCSIAARAASR